MQVRGWPRTLLQGSRLDPVELSSQARRRLEALEMWRRTGQLPDVCEVFGFSRATLYRWKRRYQSEQLNRLEDRSRQPHRRRRPEWSAELVRAVERLRRRFPRWGKAKLTVLLHKQENLQTSASTVGRILTHLRKRGVLVDPLSRCRTRRRRSVPRPWARRCPGGPPPPRAPGDLAQVDTLQFHPLPGVCRWQFTARDVVSRWDVLEAHGRPTARAAEQFLSTLQSRFPFPIRALQIDGGSEFMASFEHACQRLGIRLYLLPPHSPKLNGYVERANGTHRQEFYDTIPDCPWEIHEINRRLRAWEHTYNHVRPHQALNYLTPAEFLEQYQQRGSQSHM